MKCVNCGGTMKKAVASRYHYRESGLTNVYLRDVSTYGCQKCGAVDLDLPDPEGLHAQLAESLVALARPLSAGEFRFLRKQTGHSGKDFSKQLGVAPETISRWENGREPISGPADLVVRHLALNCSAPNDYSVSDLNQVHANRRLYRDLVLQFKKQWRVAS